MCIPLLSEMSILTRWFGVGLLSLQQIPASIRPWTCPSKPTLTVASLPHSRCIFKPLPLECFPLPFFGCCNLPLYVVSSQKLPAWVRWLLLGALPLHGLPTPCPPTAIIFLHGRCVDELLHHRCCILCLWWLGLFGASQSDLPSPVQLVFYVVQLPVGLGPNAGNPGSRAPAPGQQPLHDAHP
ncbi:hypothetical protein DSO57_1039667 [Entomophthora muscae]|uniref:Uncharacterized protein n=1 Tax=Entomophthora muscae TaxID=34485 RepID=A0ACC2SQF0_9FUNG|nr:hypothetical protein DSO57_1039667 [Entomophthora muscae]